MTDYFQILDTASKVNPKAKFIWEEKLQLCISDDKKVLSVLQEATKVLKPDDALHLWNIMLDNVDSKEMVCKINLILLLVYVDEMCTLMYCNN